MLDRLLTLEMVMDRTTLSKTEIYRRKKLGVFPIPVKLGPKRIAFVEVEAWIASQLEGGRANG
jgi:predicted DNA-binding transcriptional regulator AlpA